MNLYWNSFTTVLGLLMEILYIYYFKPKVIHEKNDAPPEQRLAQNLNEAGLMWDILSSHFGIFVSLEGFWVLSY